MLRFIRILLLALLATLGLAACSSVNVEYDDSVSDAAAPDLPAGRPAFLISYADW